MSSYRIHTHCSETHVRLLFDPRVVVLTRNPLFQSHTHWLSWSAPQNDKCQITIYVEVMLKNNQIINRANNNYYNITHLCLCLQELL